MDAGGLGDAQSNENKIPNNECLHVKKKKLKPKQMIVFRLRIVLKSF